MGSGGARNRSGPQVDPLSGRSEARGVRLDVLPAAGFDGPVPEWPLQKRMVWVTYKVDKEVVRERDEGAEVIVAERERQMWEWAWRTPQAVAWARPEESWRLHTVAMWVRTFVVCESSEATAADKNSLHRFADQIGLTPAGLRENGWSIAAADQVGEVAPAGPSGDELAERRKRRLRA